MQRTIERLSGMDAGRRRVHVAWLGLAAALLLSSEAPANPVRSGSDPISVHLGPGQTVEPFVKSMHLLFRHLDIDGDGAVTISDQEHSLRVARAATRSLYVAELLGADWDADGIVTREELVRLQAHRKRMSHTRVDPDGVMSADLDGDGRLDWSELVAYAAKVTTGSRREDVVIARYGKVLPLDADRDGRLTLDEFEAAMRQRFARVDADRDGVISTAEAEVHARENAPEPAGAQISLVRTGPAVGGDAAPGIRAGTTRDAFLAERRAAFAKLDMDDDETLTSQDLDLNRSAQAALRRAGRIGGWLESDVDGNGELSRDELARPNGRAPDPDPRIQARRESAMPADLDSDGRVSGAELLSAAIQHATRTALVDPERNYSASLMAKRAGTLRLEAYLDAVLQSFDRIDTDRDGTISSAEFEAAAAPPPMRK